VKELDGVEQGGGVGACDPRIHIADT
jgi:hypothetical protein